MDSHHRATNYPSISLTRTEYHQPKMQAYTVILAVLGLAATAQAACGGEGDFQVQCGSTCYSCDTSDECNTVAVGAPTCG